MASAPLLSTTLGTHRLLARPGDRRLWVLDAAASTLWDIRAMGATTQDLAALLVERFALSPRQAHTQVTQALARWRDAGLLDAVGATAAHWGHATPDVPLPTPHPRPLVHGARALPIADRWVGLVCDDETLRHRLWALLGEASRSAAPARVDHHLHLQGRVDDWQLACDGVALACGHPLDDALVATLTALIHLGCRPAEQLLVLHGAGLVTPSGCGLLLVAPGGSGKTTLAAALNAAGCALLSDDVVPVTLDGELLGLNLPLCLKPGSWPVLTPHRADLEQTTPVARFGQQVRLLTPQGTALTQPVPAACLLLPRYAPEATARIAPLSPVEALAGLLSADAVIRALTQDKLERLARWVEALPAFAVTYPDLSSGLAQVDHCLRTVTAARGE